MQKRLQDASVDLGNRMSNIVFIMLGVAVLLFKRYYAGPFAEVIDAYAANVAVSFAVYFNAALLPVNFRYKRLWLAGLALAAVELFEVSNGFGIMSNVYDSMDLVANGVGVLLALVVDSLRTQKQCWNQKEYGQDGRL